MKMVTLQSLVSRISQSAGQEKYPILSITAGVGFVNQAEKFGREIAGAQYIHYTVLKKGDFSYNKGNSKAYPQGCIYCLENLSQAAVPNVFNSFRFISEKALPAYYKYVFESGFLNKQLYRYINSGVRNDGLLNLYDDDFYSCQVPCPPIEKQRKIAEILGCCDEVIRLKKELIAEKKKQKKALMQKLLDPNSGFRLPGFSGEWEQKTIAHIADLLTGYPFDSKSFSTSGIKLLRCSNIKRGELDWNPVITEYWNDQSGLSDFLLQPTDIVIAMDGALVGYSYAQIRENDLPLLLVQRVARLRARKIEQGFLKYLIMNPAFGTYVDAVKTTTAIPHISSTDILEFNVKVPVDNKEQQAIAEILSAADQEIDLLEQELSEQKKKKKSLMQLLLTGIVRGKK